LQLSSSQKFKIKNKGSYTHPACHNLVFSRKGKNYQDKDRYNTVDEIDNGLETGFHLISGRMRLWDDSKMYVLINKYLLIE